MSARPPRPPRDATERGPPLRGHPAWESDALRHPARDGRGGEPVYVRESSRAHPSCHPDERHDRHEWHERHERHEHRERLERFERYGRDREWGDRGDRYRADYRADHRSARDAHPYAYAPRHRSRSRSRSPPPRRGSGPLDERRAHLYDRVRRPHGPVPNAREDREGREDRQQGGVVGEPPSHRGGGDHRRPPYTHAQKPREGAERERQRRPDLDLDPAPYPSSSSSSSTRAAPSAPDRTAALSREPTTKGVERPSVSEDVVVDHGEGALAAMLGIQGFGTTKNKHHEGQIEGADVKKERTWRQYMNRKGGFNRVLDQV